MDRRGPEDVQLDRRPKGMWCELRTWKMFVRFAVTFLVGAVVNERSQVSCSLFLFPTSRSAWVFESRRS